MTRRQTLTVKLRRPSRSVPWGISIAGGSDLGTPLVVTRSENEELQKGDVIKKIDEYDVRDLRHVDAQNLLSNSESVKLAIERSESYIPSRTDVSSSSIIIDNNYSHTSTGIDKFVIVNAISRSFHIVVKHLFEQLVLQLF